MNTKLIGAVVGGIVLIALAYYMGGRWAVNPSLTGGKVLQKMDLPSAGDLLKINIKSGFKIPMMDFMKWVTETHPTARAASFNTLADGSIDVWFKDGKGKPVAWDTATLYLSSRL